MGMKYNEYDLGKVVITDIEQITSQVFIIRFERNFDFQPGQVIGVSVLSNTEEYMPRMYSISSGNTDKYVSIFFNVKEDGWLTPLLGLKQVGDWLYITPPSGSFTDTNTPSYWIATGTGIAPFHSMFKSGINRNKTIIQGARTLDSFYYSESFLTNGSVEYVRCCSQEESDNVYNGRLTKYLKETKKLPIDQKYYLCGVPEMVVEVRDILIDRGIPYDQIIAEIYF